jgi:hypothetical protein
MADNSTYALTSSGSWVVPPGVTSITVECFGSALYVDSTTLSDAQTARSGASYSKSTNIAVSTGQTFYHNIGASGGNTWFNTVNSAPVVGVDGTTTSCLAVGANTASASQVAANIGDTKYAGGAGLVSTGTTVSGSGGNAGPNGAGAAAGVPFSNTPQIITETGVSYFIGSGGGGNGGSQGSLGVIPYGRTGSGGTPGAGNGGYWDGSSLNSNSTDFTSSSSYIGVVPQILTTNYGALGGYAVNIYYDTSCCANVTVFRTNPVVGKIIITLNSPTQKSFALVSTGSFTVPADFVSLISLEAVGVSGNGASTIIATSGGGGGGGAYSKTLGSSVSTSIVAGSTVVYANIASGTTTWLRIGSNSAPSSVANGVLANNGASASTNTGAAGGLASTSIGDVKFNGGQGGQGWTASRYAGGGGGGSGGPSGAGAIGGAAFNTSVTRGAGGGGASNGGNAGSAGLTAAGGQGGTITGGTGGAGAFTSPNTNAVAGTNGGGGGGGFGASFSTTNAGAAGGYLNINSVYGLVGGYGGRTGSSSPGGGSGGGGNGGAGVVVFTYSTVAVTANTGNFFLMF